MFLDPRQLLNSWWIDQASVLVPLLCSSTPPRQLHLSTLLFLIPSLTDDSTPIDTSICRELLRIYIKDKHDSDFIFFRSLSIPLSSHLPNHFRSIQTTFQVIFNLFEGFSSLGMFLISHFLSFKTQVFGVFEKFWGFSKLMSFC